MPPATPPTMIRTTINRPASATAVGSVDVTGGGEARTSSVVVATAATASTVTPKDELREETLLVTRVFSAAVAAAELGAAILASTRTDAEATVRLMSCAVIPLPNVVARALLKASASKASTVPEMVMVHETISR